MDSGHRVRFAATVLVAAAGVTVLAPFDSRYAFDRGNARAHEVHDATPASAADDVAVADGGGIDTPREPSLAMGDIHTAQSDLHYTNTDTHDNRSNTHYSLTATHARHSDLHRVSTATHYVNTDSHTDRSYFHSLATETHSPTTDVHPVTTTQHGSFSDLTDASSNAGKSDDARIPIRP
jgi:hypothetical protein